MRKPEDVVVSNIYKKGLTMRASVGDRLVIKGHIVGEPDRDAKILEVRGPDGEPPYFVRWDDDGHEGLLFPGSDAAIEHFPAHHAPASNDHE